MVADAGIWNRVEAVLGSGVRLVLATTGGGSELVTWLLNHPGASRAVVEVQVPYHERAVQDYLGAPGPHRANADTARDLATRAFARLRILDRSTGFALGLGCTAALATNRVRRGDEQAFLALRLEDEYRFFSLDFVKGGADRLKQEDILSRFALTALEEACGMPLPGSEWPAWVRVEKRVLSARDPIDLLLRGEVDVVAVGVGGRAILEVERGNRLLVPGSFNPFHRGHAELAAAVQPAAWTFSVPGDLGGKCRQACSVAGRPGKSPGTGQGTVSRGADAGADFLGEIASIRQLPLCDRLRYSGAAD